MAEHIFRLSDIGEGIAEVEMAEWLVKVGDVVREDDVICEITTDKAMVEIPASISGKVVWLGCAQGEVIAVGSDLIAIESAEAGDAPPSVPKPQKVIEEPSVEKPEPRPKSAKPAPRPRATPQHGKGASGKPLAAPSVRARAQSRGVDLRQVGGTGPAGRILHEDLDAFVEQGPDAPRSFGPVRRMGQQEIRVSGVRRKIAERMTLSHARIPHFSIVEEVDVDALEDLRAALNHQYAGARGKLTLLPFILRALAVAIQTHPAVNAHYDDEGGLITQYEALHCGIATQTDSGLMVPVLRHAEALDLWKTARDMRRLADEARNRKSAPSDLTGSTITVTSLGPLGAIATTPIINHPEVAIVGINKISVRPVWLNGAFAPRRMMNLSCSFDHRVVDGFVAAEFVAAVKQLLETPAMLFMELGDD